MRRLLMLLLFVGSSAMAADNGAELQRLYAALTMLNQEQQAVYQQFQMVQELVRGDARALCGIQSSPMQSMGEVPNYADVIDAQKKAVRRGEALYQQAEQLLAKYDEIEQRKQPLRERIYALSLAK